MELDEIVALSVKHNASDLHLCCGHLPWWRCQGQLTTPPGLAPVSDETLHQFCDDWLSDEQQQQLLSHGHCDTAVTTVSGIRLRACIFRRNGGMSLALRILRQQIPSMESLGIPAICHRLTGENTGLILFTGATGCGKSTSLAAMINTISRQRALHIITLEDPVEYIYDSQRSLIQQREAGRDFSCFSQGLVAALRQDPDIIMLGELRDPQTIRLALTAAETGHLVLATLHTRTAAQAVERLVDSFPPGEKAFVSARLAACLTAVIAQRLVDDDKQAGQQRAEFEVLVNTPAVASVIREGKTHLLAGIIQTSSADGMQCFPPSAAREAGKPTQDRRIVSDAVSAVQNSIWPGSVKGQQR
ncbi:type IV pilus twitching motility protein PilT [Tatumella citrea]|uniref:Cyclic nucleotide-binding domain-containing protein n=1 Tax=Tatumella citrea TaxID=53336 RepID=A0A1Y0L5M2_TATCI|nr:PilT/PilU family type 4a pilus ATPase [Tatumella citrea]ARU93020.1 hypothetical protein A7K98_03925 [Tatumella citrea]ARU97058.1 hypothetical protein A7K99_03925 [Tatumella citrea]